MLGQRLGFTTIRLPEFQIQAAQEREIVALICVGQVGSAP